MYHLLTLTSLYLWRPLLKSNDSGKTFSDIGASNVHVDHHDLWINPNDNNHLVLGNDGGVNISYDQGDNWIKLNQPSVGQFYSINVDNSEPYNVYGIARQWCMDGK